MNTLLGIELDTMSKKDILEKIKKNILEKGHFMHVVSVNPENIIIARTDKEFKRVINTAQIRLVDGVGVVIAAQVLGLPIGERFTGSSLMETLLAEPAVSSLRVMLIGGRHELANNVASCYQQLWPQARFVGVEGIKNIKNPTDEEEEAIFSIVSELRPHLVFVSFGSPTQEKWIEANKDKFGPAVVMGVGGAFDFLSGRVKRAPKLVQTIGGEWLYRLARQPWRFKRQLRLLEFMKLVLQEKLASKRS